MRNEKGDEEAGDAEKCEECDEQADRWQTEKLREKDGARMGVGRA